MEDTTGVTVKPAAEAIFKCLAVMEVEPAVAPVANPDDRIVATEVLLELQLTDFVTSATLPSLNVPIATYWSLLPADKRALAGFIAIDFRLAASMISVICACRPPAVNAFIGAVPALIPFANPVFVIVAHAQLEDQVTRLSML